MINLFFAFLILFNVQFAFGEASRNFDGVGDRLGQTDIFNVTTGSISVCEWSNLTEDASIDVLIGKRTTTGEGYSLQQNTSDFMTFVADGTTDVVTSVSTTDVDGSWYASCGTWDGANDITTLYINGVQEDQDDVSDRGSLTTGAFLRMGQDGGATADYDANGLLSNGTVFNTVILTAVQVNEWMWRPELSGVIVNMLIPIWGDNPEIDLSANDDTASVTGTTTNVNGPPIMIGDASL